MTYGLAVVPVGVRQGLGVGGRGCVGHAAYRG